jgi:DNA-binding NarL/FixJ family response regulator
MSTIGTLIVDDSQKVRRGIRAMLNRCSELEVIGEASNGQEAIEKVLEFNPGLIIMDVTMPVLDGLAAAEAIKVLRPGTEIVMFSMHKIREVVETVKMLGPSGYALKEESASLLLAIDAVLHHKTYFPEILSID